MKTSKRHPWLLIISVGLLLAPGSLWAAEGIISKEVAIPEQNYCHLRFPAIRPDTLYSNRPVLQDPRTGDIVDYYGPCDYDPLGKEQVQRQRQDARHKRGELID